LREGSCGPRLRWLLLGRDKNLVGVDVELARMQKHGFTRRCMRRVNLHWGETMVHPLVYRTAISGSPTDRAE
jgi:hypothetical protein